jgi:hypothetical protein
MPRDPRIMVAEDIFLPVMKCECCGISEREMPLKSSRIMGASCICTDCVIEWYDGHGSTNPEEIGAYVRAARAARAKANPIHQGDA